MGIGDELIAAGQARAEFARSGRRVQILGRDGAPRWYPLWEGLDYIARPVERGDFVRLVNGPGVRPYHLGKSPQQWTYNPDFRPTPAEIRLSEADEEFGRKHAGRIIVEPHIKKKASPNKAWGWIRWEKLAYLAGEAGLELTQMGAPGTPTLTGAEFIETPSILRAAAVLKHARAAVLPEGGLHHISAAVGLRAVVIFGGFTPVELTGYEGHVNLGASIGDACGMRVPCEHCARWMASIKPEAVLKHLMGILNA